MRPRIKRLGAVLAMVVLISFVYYFSYHYPEVILGYTATKEGSVIPTTQDNDIATPIHQQDRDTEKTVFVSTASAVQNVVPLLVSDSFRKAVVQNTAFWNRKLMSFIKQLDKGDNSEKPKLSWSNCRETNEELLKTNMHDFSTYPDLHKDFLYGLDCRDPAMMINQPDKCSGGEEKVDNLLILFAIKSTPQNFEQRQVVRQTWGREGRYEGGVKLRTVFLLGSSARDDPDLGQLIAFEANHFQDLLQWDFHESFFNLTLKEQVFYRWTMEHCSGVSFVFKGDDDVFVNRQAIFRYLKSLSPEQTSKLYAGQIIKSATPLHDPQSKYYIPSTFFDGPYPPYAGGGGFLFSGSLIQPLYSISQLIPLFPIDDVYTGMCFQAIGITPTEHQGFKTFDIQEHDRENLCIHKDLLLVHKRSPQQTMKLWRGVNSPLLTC
ncbi:N-acetyllactosaminide beta-1,3-N-acetylglucosaminyltransferase 2 [Hypomesus transpacificus]|uniref:N-acetyllactosaminide beta-1,3-N-acetylglucosaminyltransferase 2 n=1 Tax=Hypomesus transpacificus TaxID=137520 RepID=UPI001F0739B7|nr:N-acetyllactosaminide beta-1,3-N-acetylglucosaminyltransferase 2 [Hypomesus transpacificus]